MSKLQFRNPTNFLPTDSLYFGPKVAIAFQKNVLSDSDKKIFQTNCLNFYCELLKQFHQRFPFNSNEVLALKELTFPKYNRWAPLQITLDHLSTISMNWTQNGDCFKIITINHI